MARFRIPTVVVDEHFEPAADRDVTIRRGDGAPAVVYDAEEGGSEVEGTLRTDDLGRVPGWVEAGSYVAEVAGEGGMFGAQFQLGPAGPRQPLELTGSWENYPGYAPATFAVGSDGAVSVSGVIKAPEEGGSSYFAALPRDLAPSRTREIAALLGVVTPAGVEPRPGTILALTDGRLRAPNQPCKWLSPISPIER